MKTFRYISAMTAIISIVCCQQDELENVGDNTSEHLTADIETFIQSDEEPHDKQTATWSENDMFILFDGNDSGQAYKLSNASAGSTHGEFCIANGLYTEGTGKTFNGMVAVFPYDESITIQAEGEGPVKISGVIFPEEQTIIESGVNTTDYPMTAFGKPHENSLSFKNTGGLIKLALRGNRLIHSLTLTGNSDEIIAGQATISINKEEISEISFGQDGGRSVTVRCESPIQLKENEPTIFHIFLPPMEFKEGFSVTLKDINGEETHIGTESQYSIIRSHMTYVSDLIQEDNDICIFKDGTYSYTAEHLEYITIVNYRQVKISKSIPSDLIPSIGSIIIVPATENAPHGLIGKISSIQDNGSEIIVSTGAATLQETFKNLRIKTSFDISSYLESAKDRQGNVMKAISCPEKASGNIEFKKLIPIENDYFDGNLGFSFNLDININISDSRLRIFDVSFEKESGLSGEWTISNIENEFECKFAELELKFRPILIPGTPIYIVPVLYAEESLSCTGKLKFRAEIDYKFEHQTYTFSYRDGISSAQSKSLLKDKDRAFRFNSIEAETAIKLTTLVGGKMSLYNEDLLSFGVDLSLSENIKFEDTISLDDKDLFLHNPEVEVSPDMTATIYCESFLLGLLDMKKLEHDIKIDVNGTRLNTLPAFSKMDNRTQGGVLTATANVETDNLLKCQEKGFALFEEGNPEPVEHICFDDTDDEETMQEARFRLPSPSSKYNAIPYVKVNGDYHYDDSRWVDLGLSVNWAKWNVGAESPEEYGSYYAWGETEPKSEYTHQNYIYNIWKEGNEFEDMFNFIYIGKEISKTEYDAAYVKWGDGAHMPDISKFKELYEKCIWEDGTYNNVKGCHVTGPKGNSIFIPYSGVFDYQTIRHTDKLCYLWCSTLESQNQDICWGPCPYSLKYDRNQCIYNNTDFIRVVGMPIRAVKNP